jgi:hypothetical protein
MLFIILIQKLFIVSHKLKSEYRSEVINKAGSSYIYIYEILFLIKTVNSEIGKLLARYSQLYKTFRNNTVTLLFYHPLFIAQ